MGYGDINMSQFGAMANYNALQISATRRVSRLTFGANYTWSKALGTAGARTDVLHPTNYRMANYGPLFYDSPHQFVFNYTWDLPNGARGPMNNMVGRAILNGWEISGITSLFAGEPENITFGDLARPNGTFVGGGERNRIYTGSESVAPRPSFSGNPNGTKDIYAWIDPSVLRAPVIGLSLGLESGEKVIRKPGMSNWDISIFRNFPLGAESRVLQLRCEMFNAWNHTQFSDFSVSVSAGGTPTPVPGGHWRPVTASGRRNPEPHPRSAPIRADSLPEVARLERDRAVFPGRGRTRRRLDRADRI
jgi:hypothetical protein